MVHPFLRGRSLISPVMYFLAWVNGLSRAKHGRNLPCSLVRFVTAR
jgi:hypothetical protein